MLASTYRGVSPALWHALKVRALPEPRYLHVSCEAYMVADPAGPGRPMIPFVSHGQTYNVGRNRAKRARRAADKAARAARIAARTAAVS